MTGPSAPDGAAGPRYLIVGDVHGCARELRALWARGGDPGRRLVLVGDLVAKGPDAHGVVAYARAQAALAVRGNHDAHALAYRAAQRSGREPPRDGADLRATCASLDEDDWAYLEALPAYLRLADVRAIVVHAGLVPGVALESQDPEHLLTMRTLRPDGTPSKRLGDGAPWASRWAGPELVVFGHDAVSGLQRHPHAIGLDTGCCYGGRLTGLRLPERELVSVPAEAAYAEPGAGGARRTGRRHRVGARAGLGARAVERVELDRDRDGRRRQALVVLDAEERPRAYLNRCKHLPIPLDALRGDVLDDDGGHLVCLTHGARYRTADGLCVQGPCEGTRLEALAVDEDGEGVVWVWDETQPGEDPGDV